MSEFILGSSSPFRVAILKQLAFVPKLIIAPDIDESTYKEELPKIYCKRIAREKAITLSNRLSGENILTADTVVFCGRRILPKALSDEDVKYCLNLLSGRRSRTCTSVCLITSEGKIMQKTAVAILKFKRFTKEEIEDYINTKEGIGKAGGFTIRGKAESFLLWMQGTYSTVVGLPAYEVTCLLRSIGVMYNNITGLNKLDMPRE